MCGADWLKDFEDVLIARFLLTLSNAQLPICIGATGCNRQRIGEKKRVVFTAGHLHVVFVLFNWTDLPRIDAFNGVVRVAKLAFRSQSPRCYVILLG